MANANTEHSRKLRAKTAGEHRKRQIAEGRVRVYSITLKREDADEFDAVVQTLGLSRPQAIKALCELYRQTHQD